MKLLVNACEVLEQELTQASQQYHAIQDKLDEFTTNISASPLLMVKSRLRLIISRILAHESSLYSYNNGKGFVYVMVTRTALAVCWEQKEYSQWHKDWFNARDIIIFSPHEAASMVEKIMSQLDSGDWADVVKWINDCGSYLISDANKYA